ncbi:hypothetical protein F511_43786 [Dorcoceras hygrometricum]|uniref:Uncharacterized protein n=1 Tax=Dorcoceras hygrometricum TaxID=472368 RepID=A0A2Z7BM65_9LAMI|nr:hypothetical protein F511_43786 [Dorcoceras hygrometricum]
MQSTVAFDWINLLLNSSVFALLLNPSMQEPSTETKRKGKTLSFLFASTPAYETADLSSSADCDDITADVIIADSDLCASSQLLIVMTSSLLLIASSRIYAEVITADT